MENITINILGYYDSYDELIGENPKGNINDAYLVLGDLYIWTENYQDWINIGRIQGPRGLEGPQGPKGDTGNTGPTGPKGNTGSIGSEGPEGPQGPTGPKGNTGSSGPEGQVGPEGPQGPAGHKGDVGPQGPTGPKGLVGSEGPEGPMGPAGPRGNTGPQGPAGVEGVEGPMGPAGPKGNTGPNGNTGPEGPEGPMGPMGPAGVRGLEGPQGAKGEDGILLTLLDTYDTYEELVEAHPTGNIGDMYLVDGDTYVWSENEQDFINAGKIKGEKGDIGPEGPEGKIGLKGEDGIVLTLLDTYHTYGELIEAHPTGNIGDMYLVNGDTYVWSENEQDFINAGKIKGEKGDPGHQGAEGPMGPEGPQGPKGNTGMQGLEGPTGPEGPMGPAGAKGNTGSQGLEGSEGAEGPRGPQGQIGPKGEQGPAGEDGIFLTLLDTYNTYEELKDAHITGNIGDMYLVDGDTYVWSENEQDWINAGELKGKTGPMGPKGDKGDKGEDGIVLTLLDTYNTYEELIEAHPTGNIGDMYLVGSDTYVWSENEQDFINAGKIKGARGDKGDLGATGPKGEDGEHGSIGPMGPKGEDGTAVEILGIAESYEDLIKDHPIGANGQSYLIGEELYVWAENKNDWVNVGQIKGPRGEKGEQGDIGPKGEDGIQLTILDKYNTPEELKTGHPAGDPGDMYLIDGESYIWSENEQDWINIGKIQGIKGEKGEQGLKGDKGDKGLTGEVGPMGPKGNTGPGGNEGAEGPEGPMGPAGPKGNTGSQGLEGPEGPEGPMGPQGMRGPEGPKGEDGIILSILDTYASYQQLKDNHPNGNSGDMYLVGTDSYIWSNNEQDWINAGQIKGEVGPKGPKGDKGDKGEKGEDGVLLAILDSFETYEELKEAHMTGNSGDLYLVDGEAYVWSENKNDWVNAGVVKGDKGERGLQGVPGAKGETGSVGEIGPAGSDGISIILSAPSHIFPAGTSSAISSSVECDVIAFKGNTKIATTIGSISGEVAGLSTEIFGNETTSASFTVDVEETLETRSGILTIPVTVDNKTFNLKFSWSLALNGAHGFASSIPIILESVNWEGNDPWTMELTINGLTSSSEGYIGLAHGASSEEAEASRLALIRISNQTEDTLSLEADGIKPEIDIPIKVVIVRW